VIGEHAARNAANTMKQGRSKLLLQLAINLLLIVSSVDDDDNAEDEADIYNGNVYLLMHSCYMSSSDSSFTTLSFLTPLLSSSLSTLGAI
jgi:hypothetical protein